MKKIESRVLGEIAYKEILDNGMEVIIIPKKDFSKKYIIWATNFGSIDNEFIVPKTEEKVKIPDGVAHFLEHKMFEMPNGKDALYSLMELGVDANAYTTSDHTAYLFECTKHFDEALNILMDYVQTPYYTDETVLKEQGIIGQEIKMYDDDPFWKCYLNSLKCLYVKNPIRIDTAGTVDSISKITPKILYDCYNTFYNPSNMVFVACGDFDKDELLEKIKSKLLSKEDEGKIRRIYPEEPDEIYKKEEIANMDISIPFFTIGIKDKVEEDKKEIIKRHLAIEILLNYITGESSRLYSELYKKSLILGPLSSEYEFSKTYAYILIMGRSKKPKEVERLFLEEIKKIKEEGIDEKDFSRIKNKLYGEYISSYNSVSHIARNFISDWMKGIENTYDYLEYFDKIDKKYLEKILNEVFKEEKEIISIVNKIKE